MKSLFSKVKTHAPFFTFCNFFRQNLLPFQKHIFECTRNVAEPYTVKNPKSQWRSGVFIVKYLTPCSGVFIFNFEHVIAGKELVNFLFMLSVIFILSNLFLKKFLCKVVTLCQCYRVSNFMLYYYYHYYFCCHNRKQKLYNWAMEKKQKKAMKNF